MTAPIHDFVTEYRENSTRHAWIQRNRDRLEFLTGVEIPQTLAEIDSWLADHKHVMSKQLNELVGPPEDGSEGGGDDDG